LIHECSQPIGKSNREWGHVDPVDAAKVAKAAGVKKLVLTHLTLTSYATDESIDEALGIARDIFENKVMGVDGMEIRE
jgi:ribonuclease BN (tRNA processing enzyme)